MKEEYTKNSINAALAKAFVVKAKKIANTMAANYNQKKNAFEMASSSYSKKGSIDVSRLHAYKTSDDIFKKNLMLNSGNSHGLVCALDFSISMVDELVPIAMQFLITSLFCKYAKIEFRFFTFTSATLGNNIPTNPFLTSRGKYARFVDIGNSTMSEPQLITAFYEILTFAEASTGCGEISLKKHTNYSIHYLEYIKDKYNQMGATPLIPAMYQSYLVAKWLQEQGIQKVKILIINDGDNNLFFHGDTVSSIEDPYSKRVYSHTSKVEDGLITSINKMARDNDIGVFNLFMSNKPSKAFFSTTITNYTIIHGKGAIEISPAGINRIFTTFNEKNIYTIDNLCYFDKVSFINSSIFPRLRNTTQSLDISEYTQNNKALTVVGNMISDFMVTDFKLR